MSMPSQSLADQLYIDKIIAARARSFEEKFLNTGYLFEALMERMRAGILMEDPSASEEEIAREIQRRLEISALLENRP